VLRLLSSGIWHHFECCLQFQCRQWTLTTLKVEAAGSSTTLVTNYESNTMSSLAMLGKSQITQVIHDKWEEASFSLHCPVIWTRITMCQQIVLELNIQLYVNMWQLFFCTLRRDEANRRIFTTVCCEHAIRWKLITCHWTLLFHHHKVASLDHSPIRVRFSWMKNFFPLIHSKRVLG
jgi:hypothetical protein